MCTMYEAEQTVHVAAVLKQYNFAVLWMCETTLTYFGQKLLVIREIPIYRGFPTRIVYLYYTSCLRYTILGPYAPQGSTPLLRKLSVTSKVSAPTSYGWVGSRVHFRSSEDVTLLEFTSPIDREYMRRRRKCH